MREVVLRVPSGAVEDLLDRLLPIVPGGVREAPRGRQVELTMRGNDVPSLPRIQRAVGRWPHKLTERETADDWRARRLADYDPDVIGGRLVVRPEWAPPPRERGMVHDRGIVDIVLSESSAFGLGAHPTTRTCLELLVELEPGGSFADLGCGTGVLAVAAAKLGWGPVTAVDVSGEAVDATRANAEANGVEVAARVLDLGAAPAPVADGFAANVPAWLHSRVAASLPDSAASLPAVAPSVALLSGFLPAEAADVLAGYEKRGFGVRRQIDAAGWAVCVVER